MNIGLFTSCLVNTLRPTIGIASLKLLEKASNSKITVPLKQTCCGQPNFNSGYYEQAKEIAQNNLLLFKNCDYVVVPSGSCGGMIKHHYQDLFANSSKSKSAQDLSNKTYELCQFLDDILKWQPESKIHCQHTFTYHDSCAGLRELGISKQPRSLLNKLNVQMLEMHKSDECCGFGGAFSVKFPEVSSNMASQKVTHIKKTDADAVIMGDLGCMMNIEGRLNRQQVDASSTEDKSTENKSTEDKLTEYKRGVYHISEILAHYSGLLPIKDL